MDDSLVEFMYLVFIAGHVVIVGDSSLLSWACVQRRDVNCSSNYFNLFVDSDTMKCFTLVFENSGFLFFSIQGYLIGFFLDPRIPTNFHEGVVFN